MKKFTKIKIRKTLTYKTIFIFKPTFHLGIVQGNGQREKY